MKKYVSILGLWLTVVAGCSDIDVQPDPSDGGVGVNDRGVVLDGPPVGPDQGGVHGDGGVGGGICPPVNVVAQDIPVDIIIAVDTSPSMDDEAQAVENNLDKLSNYFGGLSIPYRIILIAAKSGQNAICMSPPLATGLCTDGPAFMQIDHRVKSHTAFKDIISTYPQWQSFLQPNSVKHFVVITDDDAIDDEGGPSFPWPWFVNKLNQLTNPGVGSDFVLHSIIKPDQNSCGDAVRVGKEYKKLSKKTGGKILPICSSNWNKMFKALAKAVVDKTKCNFQVPTPPAGYNLDPQASTVTWTLNGTSTVLTQTASCGSGWTYDAANQQIVLCPVTCDEVVGGEVSVAFSCQPDAPVTPDAGPDLTVDAGADAHVIY